MSEEVGYRRLAEVFCEELSTPDLYKLLGFSLEDKIFPSIPPVATNPSDSEQAIIIMAQVQAHINNLVLPLFTGLPILDFLLRGGQRNSVFLSQLWKSLRPAIETAVILSNDADGIIESQQIPPGIYRIHANISPVIVELNGLPVVPLGSDASDLVDYGRYWRYDLSVGLLVVSVHGQVYHQLTVEA